MQTKKPKTQALSDAKRRMLIRKNDLEAEIIKLPPEMSAVEAVERIDFISRCAEFPHYVYPELVTKLCSHLNALSKYDEGRYNREIKETKEGKSNKSKGSSGRSRQEPARAEDYENLISETLNDPKRDIFSDKLLTRIDGLWQPAVNFEDLLKEHAKRREENIELGNKTYNLSRIRPALAHYTQTKEPEFLIDLPPWDGVDRIDAISSCVKIKENQYGIDSETFGDFLKDWFARMFTRLYNPEFQNRIFILSGPQGAGKDYLVSTLVDGLGQFSVTMQIIRGDKDTWLQLSDGLVMKISEFDKTARTEVSVLKDLITQPYTHIRAPYDRAASLRKLRCSFIATANISDLLRDYTGARRYLVFEIEKIAWNYPSSESDRLQYLAQGKALAEMQYRASEKNEARMKDYLLANSPPDPEEEVLELYQDYTESYLDSIDDLQVLDIRRRGFLLNAEAESVLSRVAASTRTSVKAVRTILKRRGLKARVKLAGATQRGYYLATTSDHDDTTPF